MAFLLPAAMGRTIGVQARPLMLVLACLALYLPGFFTIPPVDRDEPRYAQASRQMLASGDLVDVRFQDEPRHKKPVGIYWLQAASVAALGEAVEDRIWAYRLPSLLGAILAVLATAWAGRRLLGSAELGVGAALLLAGCVLMGVEARLAKTDAVLLATIVIAQTALGRIYLGAAAGSPPGLGAALTFWLAAGAGILVKGPVMPLVVGGTLLWLLVTERRIAWLAALRPLLGLPLLAAVVLPWFIAIALSSDGGFFAAIGHDALGKIYQEQESHGAPPGTYLLAFWLTFWPFSLFAGLALPWVWRQRQSPPVRFLIAWILPSWLCFELAATKLLHYVLPTFPAIALLTVAAARERFGWPEGSRPRWRSWWPVLPWGLVTLVLPLAVVLLPSLMAHEVPAPARIAALMTMPLVALCMVPLLRGAIITAMATAGAGAAVLFGLAYGMVFPNLAGLWVSPRLAAAAVAAAPCAETAYAATGYHEPSLVFLLGRDLDLASPQEAADFLAGGDCRVALVEQRRSVAFHAALAAAGTSVTAVGALSGVALNGAEQVHFRLYRRAS